MAEPETVLVDTNVFSALLSPKAALRDLYRKHLDGRRIAVTPQTVSETRYGALAAGWDRGGWTPWRI